MTTFSDDGKTNGCYLNFIKVFEAVSLTHIQADTVWAK